MKIKKNLFILMLCCFMKIYSIENYESFEDYYIQINVKNLKDDFFMIKYDVMSDDAYVGLNSLFYFLELYNINVDLDKKELIGTLNGKNISVTFSNDESFELEGELYINIKSLEKKLFFKNVNIDFSSLKLNLDTEVILPYEEREKGKLERLRLNSRKKKDDRKYDLEMPRKLITPGLFKIGYFKDDIKNSNYRMNYEYSSQLLYGEFYIDGEFKPEREINYGNLTYSDIYNDNDLILGNSFLKAPNFLNVNSKILGVSFDNNDVYMTNDSGVTLIKGEAKNVESIELYRNSFLIDYIRPFSENFEFKVDDGVLNSSYTLKIYYKDGKIEEKKVYSISDIDLLKKGKKRFTYQGGRNDENDYFQSIGKVYYGVTDNITLGLGGMNLKSDNNINYDILENDILFRFGNNKMPLIINYKNYYDYTHKENNYELEVEQKIFSYNFKFIENKYSDIIHKESDIKKYNSISLGKSFDKNSFEFGIEKISEFDYSNNNNEINSKKIKNMYTIWDSTVLSPFYTSLKIEKNIDGDNDKISYKPSVSYSNYDDITVILNGDISKDNLSEKYEQEYSLQLNFRKKSLFKEILFADLGIDVTYSNQDNEFRYGIMFNLELDDLIYARTPVMTTISNGERKTQTGLEVSKIIDLSNPKRKIKRNISLNSSWIHGKVFLDKNGNGKYDVGEIPLENVRVMVNNRYFYSDKNGEYVAEGFYNNEDVILTVDRKTIDPMMKNTKESLKIKTRRSSGARIDIPVETVSMIIGNILYTDEFSEKEFIRNISMVSIVLEKNGEIVKTIDPEFDGMYFFEDVTPGEYTIKFEYIGEENIGFSEESIPIKILLNNPDEGEYFEGYDTKLIKLNKNIEEDVEIDDFDSSDDFL